MVPSAQADVIPNAEAPSPRRFLPPRPCPAATFARLDAAMRRLPRDNPGFASDALLQFGDALAEGAAELRIHVGLCADSVEAGHAAAVALQLDRMAERARALAPVFAPQPVPVSACADFLRREEPVR